LNGAFGHVAYFEYLEMRIPGIFQIPHKITRGFSNRKTRNGIQWNLICTLISYTAGSLGDRNIIKLLACYHKFFKKNVKIM
jgi:hypothetical protein